MEEIWKDIKGYEGLYQVSNLGNVKSLNYNRTGQEGLIKACNDKYGYLILSLHINGKRKTYKIHRLVAQAFLEDYSEELEVDHIDTNRKNNNVKNLKMCTRKENDNNPLTRKHKSEAQKGENNSFYGKHHTEEERHRISERTQGENNPMYGKNHSKETKEKISKANKGKIVSKETREKLSKSSRGRTHSEETKRKISKANEIPIYCVELDRVFNSCKECAEELGLNRSNICHVLKGKYNTTGNLHFQYASDEQIKNL